MSPFTILIVLIISGMLLLLINKLVPMDGTIRKIFNVIVVVAVIVEIIK